MFPDKLSGIRPIANTPPNDNSTRRDADFNRIENIGDLIRRIEMLDNETPRPAGVDPADRSWTQRAA